MTSKLFLIPTPIGNLGDITIRAIELLKSVDEILCEDTRVSAKLLNYYEIAKPLRSYHQHNEHGLTQNIIKEIQAGKTFAMITDAGTPGISDPGFLLANACIQANIEFEVLPGAVAFVPALVASGLPNHQFKFCGFLPVKKGRKSMLEKLTESQETMIFYESPHKIKTTLKDAITYFGADRKASLSREITKKFEETKRGSLQELSDWAEQKLPKGEIVLVIQGRTK